MLRGVANQIASGLVTTVYPVQVATVQSDGTLILINVIPRSHQA